LQSVNGKRLAIGTDFNPRTGTLLDKKAESLLWLQEQDLEELSDILTETHTDWTVKAVDTKVVTRKRPAPFTTSTLQQEANR
jgi:DNA topoisomerase-1